MSRHPIVSIAAGFEPKCLARPKVVCEDAVGIILKAQKGEGEGLSVRSWPRYPGRHFLQPARHCCR